MLLEHFSFFSIFHTEFSLSLFRLDILCCPCLSMSVQPWHFPLFLNTYYDTECSQPEILVTAELDHFSAASNYIVLEKLGGIRQKTEISQIQLIFIIYVEAAQHRRWSRLQKCSPLADPHIHTHQLTLSCLGSSHRLGTGGPHLSWGAVYFSRGAVENSA